MTYYGLSMATNDDYILIGDRAAPIDDVLRVGKVYFYDYDGNLERTLEPFKVFQDEQFGRSILPHGDELSILQLESGWGADSEAQAAIYVYDSNGEFQSFFNVTDFELESHFGYSIVYWDNTYIASAPGATTEYGYSTGAVRVFDETGEILDTFYSTNPTPQANFGTRLVIDEDVIVVMELHGLFGDERFVKGVAYLYDPEWNLLTSFTAPNPGDVDNFGHSIVMNDDHIIIGDRLAEVDSIERAGEVYVYDKLGELVLTIKSPEPLEGANFGHSLAVYDDLLVIGEPRSDTTTVDTGKAYVFNTDGTLHSELGSPDPNAMGLFGDTVYIDEDLILVREVKSNTVYAFSTADDGSESDIPWFLLAGILVALSSVALVFRKRDNSR